MESEILVNSVANEELMKNHLQSRKRSYRSVEVNGYPWVR